MDRKHMSRDQSQLSSGSAVKSPLPRVFSRTTTGRSSVTSSGLSMSSGSALANGSHAHFPTASSDASRNTSSKLDVFSSLRSISQSNGDDLDGPRSPEQENIDDLTKGILSLLGSDSEHDSESSADEAKAGNDDLEIMLNRINDHNESSSHNAQPGRLRYEFEDDLENVPLLRQNIKRHFANLGEKRLSQKHKIKARMVEAKSNDDIGTFEKAKELKKRVNQRILDEHIKKTTEPLFEAEGEALRELRDLHILHQAQTALMLNQTRTVPEMDVVAAAQGALDSTIGEADGALTAVTTGYIPATSHLLASAYKSSRRSTTRFRRLYAADVADEERKQAVMEKRFEDPSAGAFIAKAVLEIGDTQRMVEMAKEVMEKMEHMLGEAEEELKAVEDGLDIALLCHIANNKA